MGSLNFMIVEARLTLACNAEVFWGRVKALFYARNAVYSRQRKILGGVEITTKGLLRK